MAVINRLIITVLLLSTSLSFSAINEENYKVTQKLREKILADESLSPRARNIQIVEVPEAIILSGPVANRSEKVKVENYARSMAGKKKVYNRLKYK